MTGRALAIQVLARVARTDAYLNVVLDALLAEHRPEDPRDAALATELAYGATRRQLALDEVLSGASGRALGKLEDRVLAALRIGAYQLFYLRIPRHAAVGATVEALKELGLGRASGFLNAVLRKISTLDALPLPPESEVARHLSVRESHPQWLVERWIRQFGRERAEAMLAADNQPAPVVVRANSAKTSRDVLLAELTGMGISARAAELSPAGIVLESPGALDSLYGYREGLWQVQDEAAQLVGIYADFPQAARVLDACAAPGGKALHQAERHQVVASDLHENKLSRIASEAKRLGLSERISTFAHDATQSFSEEEVGEVQAVLVDAPCTGLGTLRRHPELRYRRQEADVGRLAALQARILEAAQHSVPPGGLLVYAVCSTDPEEGMDQIQTFLRSHPDFSSEPPVLELARPLPLVQGFLRTLPGPEGLDGFFAARLRRAF